MGAYGHPCQPCAQGSGVRENPEVVATEEDCHELLDRAMMRDVGKKAFELAFFQDLKAENRI